MACVLAGLLGPANPTLAVGLLAVWGCLMSATYCGAFINYVDLAPNFSGILFAMGNMVASFISAFAPYAESVFVDRAVSVGRREALQCLAARQRRARRDGTHHSGSWPSARRTRCRAGVTSST